MFAIGELQKTFHRSGRVARIERPIAIGVWRVLARGAGGAAFRIRFTEDNRQSSELRKGTHDGEARRRVVQFVIEPHLHVTLHHVGFAFYMEGDEVQGNFAPSGGARLRSAVCEKGLQVGCGMVGCAGFCSPWACACRATHARLRYHCAHASHCVVVEPVVILLCAFPVVGQVRFVPNLPVPGGHGVTAVAREQVRRHCSREFLPACVIPGRERPAFYLSGFERIANVVRVWMGGEGFRHEPELHHGTYVCCGIGVEDLIENGPAVDPVAGCVFGVDVGRAPLEIWFAIAGGQKEVCADVDGHRAQVV